MQQMLRMHNVINEKGNAVVNSFQNCIFKDERQQA
jgi:hypothetical protein